ncbi:MAG: M4 family metallopeptidase [Flavobacteriales bacterium]
MRLKIFGTIALVFCYLLSASQTSTNVYYNNINIDVNDLNAWLIRSANLKENTTINLMQTTNDRLGNIHYKYIQEYNNIPVLNSEIIVHTKNNIITSLNGSVIPNHAILPVMQAKYNANEAIEIAKKYVQATTYLWENDKSYLPKAEFIYLKKNIFSSSPVYRLAYKVNIYAQKPLYHANLFIDAMDGSLLLEDKIIKHIDYNTTVNTAYSGPQSITTNFTNISFKLQATNIGGGINTYDCNNNTDYSKARLPVSLNNVWKFKNVNDKAILDVHWGTIKTYDYYKIMHDRKSYDNANAPLNSYVHFDEDFANAFWDGSRMTYGDGDGFNSSAFTSIDVIGHELTHAVTQHSANLIYQGESGALNESFSDILGTSIEHYAKPNEFSWELGNEFSLNGEPLRDLSNPNAQQNPDTYMGNFWDSEEDVHTNSGVQNYWFYLLTEGGNGTNDNGDNYAITGIGFLKSQAIAYRTLTVYLTSNATYEDARNYSILAAEDLYGPCSPESQAVTSAWYAVGVGNEYSNKVLANFSASSTFFCNPPATVQFKNLSVNANAYHWDFGDLSNSSSKTPTHTYNSPGIYSVQLIASGSLSCGNTDNIVKTNYVVVGNNNAPTAPTCYPSNNPDANYGTVQFTFGSIKNNSSASNVGYEDFTCSQATTVLEGSKVNFSVVDAYSLANIDVAMWLDLDNNGDFDSSEKIYSASSISHVGNIIIPKGTIYNTPLRLRVISEFNTSPSSACYVSNYGQTEDYTVILQKNNAAPIADFDASSMYISPASSINFIDKSMNVPTSWLWTFEGANTPTSNVQNPSVTYDNYGDYNVKLKVSNSHGEDSIAKKMYIHVVNLNLLCTNILSADSSGVLYDDGGAANDYSTNKTCTFLINPGCRDSIIIDVEYLDTEYGFDYLNIYDGANTKSDLIYHETGTHTLKKQIIAYSGKALVELTSDPFVAGAGFQLSWKSSAREENGDIILPQGPFYANSPISLGFNGITNSYEWEFGNGRTSTSANPFASYHDAGDYTIKLSTTSQSVCSQLLTKKITVLADTHDYSFSVYPNPSNGNFTITLPKNTGNEKIEIRSVIGELLYQYTPSLSDGRIFNINADLLSNAVYFITFNSDEKPKTISVVINK